MKVYESTTVRCVKVSQNYNFYSIGHLFRVLKTLCAMYFLCAVNILLPGN